MEKIIKEIKGIFNGVCLVTEEGVKMFVPENYASKSKIIKGSEIVFRISENGESCFKQTAPAESRAAIAKIVRKQGHLVAMAEIDGKMRRFNFLKVNIPFFKLCDGDEAIITIPKEIDDDDDELWAVISHKTTV